MRPVYTGVMLHARILAGAIAGSYRMIQQETKNNQVLTRHTYTRSCFSFVCMHAYARDHLAFLPPVGISNQQSHQWTISSEFSRLRSYVKGVYMYIEYARVPFGFEPSQDL
jgi:hypothetical protein